ncbi:substrate-binding domain-containing protein [Naasia lichenicola]|uniref:Sugar ABC transporter substrate-binding protein n=1 Tax=Naasia lichenicola TaxID=2565933 RepID=A0A4S4FR21_9MICO|nr:substrate-binding domain-containing protein [Naasia lichenicola]THG32814.1 sugar ABC transporter substrate-binding protein [Naasia lichenicola]
MHFTRPRLKGAAVLLALAAGIALGTAGCAATTTSPQSTSIVSETPKPSIYCGDECAAQLELAAAPDSVQCSVGVSWSATSFPYGATSSQQIPELAARWFPGMKVTVTDGQNDAAVQSGQIDEMIAQGIDVLIISPRDSDALAGVVDRAVAAGIKVIAADRDVNTTVDTYIGSDNVEAGVVSGTNIAAVLGDGGKLIELAGSLGASPTIARGDGLRTGLEGSDVTIVDSQTADYDQAKGLTVMQDLLQKYPSGSIDGVYTHNDQMAFGAIQAIKEAGREGEIQVFSIDGEDKALEYIQNGEMQSTVGYPLVTKESVIAAAKLCSGEAIDERITLDSTLIDESNVADYVGKSPQTE